MTFAVPVREARRHLGELLHQAFYQGRPFLLTRGRKPMAALVGAKEFLLILKLIEKYDPGLADTIAIMADPELRTVLEQGEKEIKAGCTFPIESLLDE